MKDIVEEYNKIWSLPEQKYLDLRVGSFVKIKVENAYIKGTITCNGFQLDQKTWESPWCFNKQGTHYLSAELTLTLDNVQVIKKEVLS